MKSRRFILTSLFVYVPLSWLRHNIDQRHLASRDGLGSAPQRGSQIFRIRDGSLPIDAHSACDHGVIDVGIFNRRADSRVGYAALMAIGHALDVHDLLMIRTIVVHDAEQRNAMVCRGPNGSRRIHEIRSEEHTSELQSRGHLVCRLLLEKKKADGELDRAIPRS